MFAPQQGRSAIGYFMKGRLVIGSLLIASLSLLLIFGSSAHPEVRGLESKARPKNQAEVAYFYQLLNRSDVKYRQFISFVTLLEPKYDGKSHRKKWFISSFYLQPIIPAGSGQVKFTESLDHFVGKQNFGDSQGNNNHGSPSLEENMLPLKITTTAKSSPIEIQVVHEKTISLPSVRARQVKRRLRWG